MKDKFLYCSLHTKKYNHYLQICALEIPQNRCIFEVPQKLYSLKYFYTTLSVQTTVCIRYFFPKYNWKYHISAVFRTVTKYQKGTGSGWGKTHKEKLCFLQAIYLQCCHVLVCVIMKISLIYVRVQPVQLVQPNKSF